MITVATTVELLSNREFSAVSVGRSPEEIISNFMEKAVGQYQRDINRRLYIMHMKAVLTMSFVGVL